MNLEQEMKKCLTVCGLWIVCMFIIGWFFGAPVFAETVPVENGNVICGWFYEVRGNEAHQALDFPANKYTPIKAVTSGRVINADYHKDLGNYVDIFDGTSVWRYAHLQQYFVSIDGYVTEGGVFASAGSTGLRSRGSHLHLERRVNGKKVFFTNVFGVKFKIIDSKLQK